MTKQSNNKKVRLFFTGFGMGMADLVPGVSGGTIAFLMGIYDELLFSIKTFTGKVPRLILQKKFTEAFKTIPFKFLVPVTTGMFSAIFSLIFLVRYLLENHATYVWSLFFGLVLCSAYIVSKRVDGWNIRRFALLFVGFIVTYMILGLPVLDTQSTPLVLFGSGMIAITAMILPGISGSLILVILGQYKALIDAVTDRKILEVLTFAFGALVGISIFSRVLSWLLKIHHSAVIATIVGILIGSLRRVWPWQEELSDKTFVNQLPNSVLEVVICISIAATGAFLIFVLERKGLAAEHDDIDSSEFKKEMKEQHD